LNQEVLWTVQVCSYITSCDLHRACT